MIERSVEQNAARACKAPTVGPELRDRMALGLIIAALLLPLIFASSHVSGTFHLGLPRVHSGDEPHYLVTLNSLLLDGDLNLAKNYSAVHEGAGQAGKYFAGTPLDDHTVWLENGQLRRWSKVYECDPAKWDHDAHGHLVPRLRAGQTSPSPGHVEYSIHPPGLALLLAPLLFPFRGTTLVEPLAIVCSTLAIISAMFLFRALVMYFEPRMRVANLITAATFLGTPAWHYGRTLFNEPYLLLFAVGAFSLALRGRSLLVPGMLIGVGMLMKPPFLLLAIPIGLMLLWEKKMRAVAVFAMPLAVSTAFILWFNFHIFGSPWRAPQKFETGSFLTGASGLLFSWNHGCLLSAPALLVALLAWPSFYRAHTREALVLIGGASLYFCLFSFFITWNGGDCYGPRYLVPVLPLLFLPLVTLSRMKMWRDEWGRHALVAVCLLSIGVNFLAANPYWTYWESNPLAAQLQRTLENSP